MRKETVSSCVHLDIKSVIGLHRIRKCDDKIVNYSSIAKAHYIDWLLAEMLNLYFQLKQRLSVLLLKKKNQEALYMSSFNDFRE